MIKNPSMSHIIALAEVFIHYHEYKHWYILTQSHLAPSHCSEYWFLGNPEDTLAPGLGIFPARLQDSNMMQKRKGNNNRMTQKPQK